MLRDWGGWAGRTSRRREIVSQSTKEPATHPKLVGKGAAFPVKLFQFLSGEGSQVEIAPTDIKMALLEATSLLSKWGPGLQGQPVLM